MLRSCTVLFSCCVVLCVGSDSAGVCPANERYSGCIQGECRALNCTEKDQPVLCARIDPKYCKKECVCVKGYLRAEDGTCVLESQCETNVCPQNEEWSECSQATCRAQNCTELGQPKGCPSVTDCDKACVCKYTYLRDESGDCVPQDKCPPLDCSERPNEEFDPCSDFCPTDDCSLAWVKRICPFNIGPGAIKECNPKCQCKDGYGRVEGICVPFSKCSNLCPAYEEYSPCIQETCRPQICADRDNHMTKCPAVEANSCERGCVCQEGYYRSDDGNCISYEQCGECGPNQEIRCINSCPPLKTCRNRGIQFSCLQVVEPCENKCVCKDGFFQNALGDCITNEECDKCPDANEYFACNGVCDNICSTIHLQNKTNCPWVNIVCTPMCYCDDGYARDDKGNCIPIKECAPPRCTGKDEVYTDCKQTCPPEVCSSIVSRYRCDNEEPCKPGCACRPGTLRKDANSSCEPICLCPEMKYAEQCLSWRQNQ